MVPNEIIDEHLSKLSGAEIKVLLAISRKTVGWHKDTDWICNKQMMDITGLSEPTVIKAIKGLLKAGLILKERIGILGKEKLCYELDFDEGVKKVKGGGKETLPVGLNNFTHNIKTTKETIQKKKELPTASTPLMKIEKEYFELFKAEYGDEPDYNYPACRKLINKYLKTYSEEKIMEIVRIWFHLKIGEWHGYRFMNLQKDWNRLLIIYNSLSMHTINRDMHARYIANVRMLNEQDNKTIEEPEYDEWRRQQIERRYEELTVSA